MTVEKAKCNNCGFNQEKIFRSFRGSFIYALYTCKKCKKIISHNRCYGKLENCPDCGFKLIPIDEKNFYKDYHICPKCGKKKLKFYLQGFT